MERGFPNLRFASRYSRPDSQSGVAKDFAELSQSKMPHVILGFGSNRISIRFINNNLEARGTCRDRPEEAEGPGGQNVESIPDSLPLIGADTDWREFRARLIASQTASTSGRPIEQSQQVWGTTFSLIVCGT